VKQGMLLLAGFVAAIWVLAAVNAVAGDRLDDYGIVPRTSGGLWGIPLAPFLHAGFGHALSNTVPLLMLGGLVAARGWQVMLGVTLFVVLLGGAGVWLVARGGSHVGASGLVFGYFGYLVARGWHDRRIVSIIIAVAVMVLYGGLLFGVLPVSGRVSWEGHLTGLLAGVLAARFGKTDRQEDVPASSDQM
jgi:membrane associated rhomboid family serine protease